jgi:hypothetical protein
VPLSSLRRTFDASIAMNALIFAVVSAACRITLRRTCLRTLTNEMRSGSIAHLLASSMMILVRHW